MSTARYIRVKRQNQTFCFNCDPTETVYDIKERVVAAANQHCGGEKANEISTSLLQILKSTEGSSMAEDTETAADLPDVLYVVLQIADDEWEPVDVISTDFGQEAAS